MSANITNLDLRRRPVIKVKAGELPTIVAAGEAALIAAGGIYQRGGQLVRICQIDGDTVDHGVKRKAGAHIIQPVSVEYLRLAMSRAATWKKVSLSGNEKPCDPQPSIAASLLSLIGEWKFPVLTGLVAAPTIRADGTLLNAAGYDSASGLFGAFDPTDFPTIKPKPSVDDAMRALQLLEDLFSETVFTGGMHSEHAAVAIAALITASVRHALPMAPAFAISAAKMGSGKTTVARAIGQVATGREPPVIALSDSEAELKKCLLAILIAGDACVLIDNVAHPVDSATLCALLTSASYSDRVLGVSQKITVPTASTWLFTGNHLEFVGDLTTRVLLSTLDPEVENPESRPFKRDLAKYVTANRGELLTAALTIPLAYFTAGSPHVDVPRSRFSEWDAFVRRPMLWLGCADPLKTQEALRGNDPERECLVALLHAWRAAFGSMPTTVNQATAAASACGQSARVDLYEAIHAVAGNKDGTLNNKRFGNYLKRVARRIEDGIRFDQVGKDPVTKRPQYGVTGVIGVPFISTRESE